LSKIEDYIDEEALISRTRRFVQIPTENPPGDYEAMARLVEEEAKNVGLSTKIVRGLPNKPNVFGLIQGEKADGYTLLLSGHMDVVPAGDKSKWRADPFAAEIAEGYIWGRGTADMKGALAAALEAIAALKRSNMKLSSNVMFGATVDDEIAGDMGQKYMIEKGFKEAGFPIPSFHILGEATYLNMMVSFKGRIWFTLKLLGKAAHGGAPSNGINAIDKSFRFYSKFNDVFNTFKENHPLVGSTTLNIGVIKGGLKCNIVPDECVMQYDLRMTPKERADDWVKKVQTTLSELSASDPDFKVGDFEVFEKRMPIECNIKLREINILFDIIQKVTKKTPEFQGTLSAGDLYHSLTHGIPGVWIGPGDPNVLHQVDERIEIDQLIKASRIYAGAIEALCS